jgi:putative hemolysin
MPKQKKVKPIKAVPVKASRNRLKDFRAHIPILIEKKNYLVKTADNPVELRAALQLRHDVFLEELLHRKKKSGLDIDRFDKRCDHLLIIERHTGMLIGTYRLQSSLHTRKWYTATEFHMKHIKRLPGNKLELGRACVHPDFRNGVTIALLWEGITAYMIASQTQYLFGCSSIKTTHRDEINSIYYYLKQNGHILDDHKVRPRGRFKVPGMRRHLKRNPVHHSELSHEEYRHKIPSLLTSYLKVGAKVCGAPALDRSFKCIDFLTLFDVSNMQSSYKRKLGAD